MDAQVPHDLLDPVVGEVAVAAVDLQGLVATSKPVSVAMRFAIAQSLVASSAPASREAAARHRKVLAHSSSVAMSASLNWSAWKSARAAAEALRSPA